MERFSAQRRFLAAALLVTGCGRQATPPPAPASAAYAEPKICAACHAEIALAYQATGMGRSIGPPVAGNLPALIAHRASGLTYRVFARGGAIVQRRSERGYGGGEANAAERRADAAIGSGNHARSLLSRNREGNYVELPVTWYAANGGFWEMSPGYERAGQEDFRRIAAAECLFCHSSYAEPLQPIDCQRCHGPGRAHAESGGRAAVLNPKHLSRERQIEVCMQCHLETTSSPLPDSIRRFGRDVRSYRPGEPLGDYKLYFDHAPGAGYEDKFEIAHAAYRLRQSACFQKSAMTCTTCHDPHRARRGGEAAGCRQCHTGPHHPETTCIDCHMPKRRAEDAIHVAMTDHFIRRRPAAKASVRREPASYRGEVALYYPAALPPGPESEAYLAVAQVRHGANLDGGIPRLEAAILKLAPAEPEFYFELGMAYSKKGNEEEAARRFEEALRRRPGFRPAVKGLAASLLALRRFGEAAALLERQTDADARMLTNRGQALLELGRTEEAVAVLERALASNPDLAEPHDLLGLAWVRRGDDRRAESEFRLALVAQPDLATAHANLGSLMARRRDLAQARYHFTRALEIDPGASETHRNYAFLLILLRDYAGARREFETAARLAPTNPLAWVDLAELEAAAGRDEKAAAAYRAALERSPRLAEAHLGLGKLLAQRGEVREAIGHLRAAVESAPGMAEARAALGILLLREGRESEARAHLEAAARSDDAAVRNLAVKALASRGSPISRERPASSPPP